MKLLKKMCCIQLRTAAFVIGILGCVGTLFSIWLYTTELIKINYYYDDEIQKKYDLLFTSLRIEYWVKIVISIVSLITSFLLIMGALKKHHLFVLPWLIVVGVFFVLFCIGFLYGIVFFIQFDTSMGFLLIYIVICVLLFVLQYYVWYGMYSYYRYLKDARNETYFTGLNV